MTTLSAAFAAFLEQLHGQSAANRRNYSNRLSQFLEKHGHRPPADINQADINAWHTQLLAQNYANASRAGYIQAIKSFFRFCVREGMLTRSPAEHLRQPSFISPANKCPPEYAITRCVNLAWSWINHPDLTRQRRAAAYLLAVETGARLSALVNLRRSECLTSLAYSPDTNGCYTAMSWSKGREYQLEFTYVAAHALRCYLANTNHLNNPDHVFTTTYPTKTRHDQTPRIRRLTKRRLTRDIETICQAAGVPIHRTHALRHRIGTIITQQYDPKVAAMKLNHSDATTTAATAIAYYYHPSRDCVSQATARLAPRVAVNIEAQIMDTRASDF